MNLLIVDDEVFAIQGILDGVDWDKLNFENIYTANSYAQALNIFVKEKVDVMLCDIEMPYGSGLDLVEWVKKEYPATECIFLTCHDEFDFARQAISLKCLDYVLKPAPPEKILEVLKKAIEVVEEKEKDENYKKFGKFYVEELAKIVYLSPDYLTRLFKKKHDMTIIDYITKCRLFLAKELLEKNEMSISMISSKVGYGNYSYFTRIFKKYCGVTPSEYQRECFKKKNKRCN